MNAQRNTFHFISHTHWDREWYLTADQYRFRLVRLIDNLIELLKQDTKFAYFHLDGQTIVLEDYLEIRESRKDDLMKLVKEGRILIGPWYEQNDLYLTSGESTVRNLMEGIRTSRAWSDEMKIGYLPDQFGLIGQMPQIFREFGIDNAVFGRGLDFNKYQSSFLHWKSPDGTSVDAILMTNWYNNAQRLPEEPGHLRTMFDEMIVREEQVNPYPHYLMMNGVDHLEAQENLTAILEQLRELYGDRYDFSHDTLPNYVRTIRDYFKSNQLYDALPVVEGELRERDDYAILAGTLSSRVYLKQANMKCHDLIEKWAEPLSAWCALKELDNYDNESFRYLWKSYMKNHPHDSICGCSQDEVHEQMMSRFAAVEKMAEEMIDRKLEIMAKQVDVNGFEKGDLKLLAVNTSQLPNRGVLSTTIYFLSQDDVTEFDIADEYGTSVPYRVQSVENRRILTLSPINLPGTLSVRRFDIEWIPSVSPIGYHTYQVRANRKGLRILDTMEDVQSTQMPVLENDRLKVELQQDGTFHLTDKRSGKSVRHLLQVEDAGDKGDLYVSLPLPDHILWKDDVEWVSWTKNDLYEECRYRFTWNIPVSLDDTLKQRSGEMAACRFEVTLRLDNTSNWLSMKVAVDNQAKDHRVRLLFPLAGHADTVLAGGQFDVNERAWDAGREWSRAAYSQPFWKWVAPCIGQEGLAVYAKGLHEYELLDEGGTMAITLLRCTENINLRNEIILETDVQEQGQCIGSHRFELALRPFAGESATRLYQEAEQFHQGLRTKLQAVDDKRWIQGRSWVQDSQLSGAFERPDPNGAKDRLPRAGVLFEQNGDAMVSAIKWAEQDQGLVVRLYNVEHADTDIALTFEDEPIKASRVNLLEEFKDNQAVQDRTTGVTLGPKKIETLWIGWA